MRPKNYNTIFSLVISQEMYDQIKERSHQQEISAGEYIREALEIYLELEKENSEGDR